MFSIRQMRSILQLKVLIISLSVETFIEQKSTNTPETTM